MSGERLYLVGEKPVAPLIWHTIKSGSSAVGIGPARLRENVAQSVSTKSQYETDPTQRLQAATLRLWCAIGAHGFSLIPALALQLSFSFDVSVLLGGLVDGSDLALDSLEQEVQPRFDHQAIPFTGEHARQIALPLVAAVLDDEKGRVKIGRRVPEERFQDDVFGSFDIEFDRVDVCKAFFPD
jgi:hypothetical protein